MVKCGIMGMFWMTQFWCIDLVFSYGILILEWENWNGASWDLFFECSLWESMDGNSPVRWSSHAQTDGFFSGLLKSWGVTPSTPCYNPGWFVSTWGIQTYAKIRFDLFWSRTNIRWSYLIIIFWENSPVDPWYIYYPLVNIQKATWNMAIDIVDVPIKHGDFP